MIKIGGGGMLAQTGDMRWDIKKISNGGIF